jgi:hypothetical protein
MTTICKDVRGAWRAEDNLDLAASKVLQISTHKVSNGAIVTRASVSTRDGAFLSHMVYRDFSQCIKISKDRCTAKNVNAQHEAAMAKLPEIQEAVTAWYAVDRD